MGAGGRHLQGAEQGLARHAGVVGALPADQSPLNEHGAQTASLGGVLGDVLTGRSRADDHDVINVTTIVGAGQSGSGGGVIARVIAADAGSAAHSADTVTRNRFSARAVPLLCRGDRGSRGITDDFARAPSSALLIAGRRIPQGSARTVRCRPGRGGPHSVRVREKLRSFAAEPDSYDAVSLCAAPGWPARGSGRCSRAD